MTDLAPLAETQEAKHNAKSRGCLLLIIEELLLDTPRNAHRAAIT